MPWKVSSEMDEGLRFISRILEGEAMTDLCLEFGISRKTGYKLYQRYKECGSALNFEFNDDGSLQALRRHLAVGQQVDADSSNAVRY